MKFRFCNGCQTEKELNEDNFHANNTRKTRFKSRCKLCRNNENRERRRRKGPEYSVWESMKSRCNWKGHPSYKYYGGRGIQVSDEWQSSFDNFLKDMGRRPSDSHTLDRIDNDGNYTKSNCRWVSRQVQSINKRAGKRVVSPETGVPGVWWREDRNKWIVYISADKKRHYIGHYSNLEDAVKARKKAELKYW